jgi:lysophospholipase L1-like esterase
LWEHPVNFAESLRNRNAQSLTVFGDSITVGLNASAPERSWPTLLAGSVGITVLRNKAISGTVLQQSVLADGKPRPGHGRGRYEADVLGADRSDAIAILYGYNDARYIAAPTTVNPDSFRRDYAAMLEGLLTAGYSAAMIAIGSPPYIATQGFAVGSEGFTGQTRGGFERYVETVRDLVTHFSVFYAPVYEMMAEFGDGALASSDITHPNDAGHQVIAKAFRLAETM